MIFRGDRFFGRQKDQGSVGVDQWFRRPATAEREVRTIALDRAFSILFYVRKSRHPGKSISTTLLNGKRVVGIDVSGGGGPTKGARKLGNTTLPPLETTAVRTVGKEKGKVNGKVLNSTPGIVSIIKVLGRSKNGKVKCCQK